MDTEKATALEAAVKPRRELQSKDWVDLAIRIRDAIAMAAEAGDDEGAAYARLVGRQVLSGWAASFVEDVGPLEDLADLFDEA